MKEAPLTEGKGTFLPSFFAYRKEKNHYLLFLPYGKWSPSFANPKERQVQLTQREGKWQKTTDGPVIEGKGTKVHFIDVFFSNYSPLFAMLVLLAFLFLPVAFPFPFLFPLGRKAMHAKQTNFDLTSKRIRRSHAQLPLFVPLQGVRRVVTGGENYLAKELFTTQCKQSKQVKKFSRFLLERNPRKKYKLFLIFR